MSALNSQSPKDIANDLKDQFVGQIVSFHCVVKDRLGHVLSSSFNQNVSTGDSPNGQLVGFSRGMRDLKVGERRRIFVAADEAYGFYDPKKIVEVDREDLPADLRVGDVVSMALEESSSMTQFRVVELEYDKVILDSNHPLAGQDLIFEIEATAVKADTDPSDESESSEESTDPELRYH